MNNKNNICTFVVAAIIVSVLACLALKFKHYIDIYDDLDLDDLDDYDDENSFELD